MADTPPRQAAAEKSGNTPHNQRTDTLPTNTAARPSRGPATTGGRLTLGVPAASRKPLVRRPPIHPLHLERIAPEFRRNILLEQGYGEPFGVSDAYLETLVRGLISCEQLIACSDVILLPRLQYRYTAPLFSSESSA